MNIKRTIIAAASVAALASAAAPIAASANNGGSQWENSGVSDGCSMKLDNPVPVCTYTNHAGNDVPKWGHTHEVYGVPVGALKG